MKKSEKFYVVRVGLSPGVYTTWAETLNQVNKFPAAKFKSFPSQKEAQSAFDQGLGKRQSARQATDVQDKYLDTRIEVDIHIYCDGVCEPNPGECSSGLSVYKNRVLDSLHYGYYRSEGTNNVAELNGLLASLKIAKEMIDQKLSVQILADSLYAINSITKWAYSWKEKNWKKKKDELVKNFEIIKEAHEIYDSIKDEVTVSHIKGHYGFEGNELADKISFLGIKEKETGFKRYGDKICVRDILKSGLRS